MREDAETIAHNTEISGARMKPAPKCRGDPSTEFQPLSNEESDLKDNIIQNVCSNFWEHIDKLDNFQYTGLPVPVRGVFIFIWFWDFGWFSQQLF